MSSTIIPCLSYRDADAAIRWLCDTFGFRKQAVYRDDNGDVLHAQLVLGAGMVMLGTARENEYGCNILQPGETGGKETQSPYVVVADPRDVHEKVKANGGEIVIELTAPDYGGENFSCRDPQGHFWNIGSYDPWAGDH